MENRTCKKNEVIYNYGDLIVSLFEIRWGSVGVYIDNDTPEKFQIAVLREGEVFGEMGLLESIPHRTVAIALEDNTVLRVISQEDLSTFFRDKPAKIVQLMEKMSAHHRVTTKMLIQAEIHIAHLEARVKKLEQSLAAAGKVPDELEEEPEVQPRKSKLAELLSAVWHFDNGEHS